MRYMIIFRIIYAVLFIAAFVFSSFYGGYVPEFIRYTLMCVPALLLIYLCVVYMRMRQKQTIQDMFIVKGEPVDYTFTVKNRDIIPYLDLRVHFYENTADISILEQASRLDILPFSTISFKGKIICKYAGVYNVGVNTIEIPDFFHVFRLKYRCRKPVKVHVRPRKIHITSIKSCISAKNNRNPYGHYVIGNDVCGSSIRNYIPGDSMKMIHWKNTAKIHELVTKQNEEIFEESTALIIDTRVLKIGITDRIIIADKILHSIVAIAESFANDNMKLEIYYKNMGCTHKIYIGSVLDFERFYETCQDITFLETHSAAGLISEVLKMNEGHSRNMVIIAYAPPKDIMNNINECIKCGCKVTLINVIGNEKDEKHASGMLNIINMYMDDDICEVLSD